jgi:hypothetical protein
MTDTRPDAIAGLARALHEADLACEHPNPSLSDRRCVAEDHEWHGDALLDALRNDPAARSALVAELLDDAAPADDLATVVLRIVKSHVLPIGNDLSYSRGYEAARAAIEADILAALREVQP